MRIVLASASPRRRELLSRIVTEFDVIPAKGEECVNLSLFPEQIVVSLAEAKCDEVFSSNSDALVIGCDTRSALATYAGILSSVQSTTSSDMASARTHCSSTDIHRISPSFGVTFEPR